MQRHDGLAGDYNTLRENGFDERTAAAITLRSILPDYSHIRDDALEMGPAYFDLGAYDLQARIDDLNAQYELFFGEGVGDGSIRRERFTSGKHFLSLAKKMVVGTGIAATALCSLALPVFAQDASYQESIFFHEKSFDYVVGPSHYSLRLVEIGSDALDPLEEINSLENALTYLRKDDAAAALFVGEFTDVQKKNIEDALKKLYQLNPLLISHLEPVIVKIADCGESLAFNNNFDGVDGFKVFIGKYGGGKSAGEVRGYKDYTEIADRILKDVICFIPTTEGEFHTILDTIQKKCFEERGTDHIDGILSGINGNDLGNTILHEFGHLVSYEGVGGYGLFRQVKGMAFSSEGRSVWSAHYIMQRDNEVNRSIKKQVRDITHIIDFYEKLGNIERCAFKALLTERSDVALAQMAQKTIQGFEHMGRQKFLDYHQQIIEARLIEWQLAERIAEDVVAVATRNEAYQREMLDSSNALEAITLRMHDQRPAAPFRFTVEGFFGDPLGGEFAEVERFLKRFGK